jgi:CelD/BcsL family acetyltransferase involved in cellulose biosynthesis
VCPYARIDDVDAYLASRRRSVCEPNPCRRRELARCAGFRIDVLSAPADVDAAMPTLFALHHARWRDKTQAFTDARIEAFHRRAALALAARGWTRVVVLHAEGQPVAAAYALLRGGRCHYYQGGLLPEWKKRSPGMVAMVHLIRHARAAGATEFDFLRGEEPYKAVWATDARRTLALAAARPTARTRLHRLLLRARAELERRLPEQALGVARAVLNTIRRP